MEIPPARMQEIHHAELDILKKCKALCETHKIPYYLCYGSLLGAVRHNGFIPWDDDIDIMIPSNYISIFKKHFQQTYSEPLFYSDIDTEKVCLEPWPKIRNSATTSMPVLFKKIPANWGICIDIFPLYPISSNPLLQKAKKAAFHAQEVLLRASTAVYDPRSSKKLQYVARLPYVMRKSLTMLLARFLYAGSENSKYVFDGFMVLKRNDIMARSVQLPFENAQFPVPCEYHSYLTEAYGNYMQLPPEEERIGHAAESGTIIWDTNHSYQTYQE